MPTLDRDITTGIIWFFQTITAMLQYSKYSLKGLRLQDFQRFEEPVRLATVTGDSDSDFLVIENASDLFPEETVGSDTVDNQAKEAQGRDVKAEEGTNKLNTEMEAAQIQAEDMVKEGSSHQAADSTLVSDSNINEDNSKDTTSEDGFVVVVNPENDNDEVASAPGEEFEQYSKTEEDDINDATSGNDSTVVIIHDNENVEGGSVSSQEVDKWDIVLNGFKKITESMEDVKQMYINFKGMPRREEQSNQSATTSSNTNDSRDIEATIRDMQARLDKVERDNNRRTKVLVFW